MKKVLACLLALILCGVSGSAFAVEWPQNPTAGQEALRAYIERVNVDLISLNAAQVNSLFEIYTYSATLGATTFDDAPMPEGTELAFTLTRDGVQKLILRTTDIDNFSKLAASCIHAATDETASLQDYLSEPEKYAKAAKNSPSTSFQQTVIEAQGDQVRTYYSYYPNQYRDGANWLQLTLIFSFNGSSSGVFTESSTNADGNEPEYAGYLPVDEGDHLQIFVTPTPEPDSPAAENQ